MEFEQICRAAREQRARIADLRCSDLDDDGVSELRVEQALYDARLLELAGMLDIPVPQQKRPDGGLDADDRSLIEDRLAEQGADLRPS